MTFQDGVLTSIRSQVNGIDSLPLTHFYSGILVPSIVNAHTHLELSYLKGVVSQGVGFVEFAKAIGKFRNSIDVEKRAKIAAKMDQVMFRQGIGAVGDISNSGFTMPVKAKSEIYYHTFAEYFGLNCDPKVAIAEVFAASDGVTSGVVSSTPHSTYLVGDEQFKAANNSARVSIHCMESAIEADFFQRRGDMYNFVERQGELDFLHYSGHVERLCESLKRDLPILLVHCTIMKKRDIESLMSHFSDLTFVLCPRSNNYISGGVPPAELLRDMGARVALGSDSLASNTSYSIVAEVESLMKSYPNLELETLLNWATNGGAAALGVGDKLGEFKVGTKCGAVLIEGVDLKTMKPSKALSSNRLV